MPRANSSVPRHRRQRKIVKQAKGYYGARSRNFKAAKDAVEKLTSLGGKTHKVYTGFCILNIENVSKISGKSIFEKALYVYTKNKKYCSK